MTTFRRLGRLFSSILVLSLASIWLLYTAIFFESYKQEWKTASLFVSNVDSLLGQDIRRNIDFYDLSMKAAAAGFGDPETMKLPLRFRQKVLFDKALSALGLLSVLIMDKDGAVVTQSWSDDHWSFNGADRDYFRIHVDGKYGHALFISHPFEGRVRKGLWSIGMSRRLENPDGSFAGVVLGTIELEFFSKVFDAVDMPPGSTIAIVHEDGTVLARSPVADIGKNLMDTSLHQYAASVRNGLVEGPSSIDHVDRLFAFRRLGDLPVILSVGIPTSYFLSRWRWRQAFIALGFLILSGFIVVLAVTLGSELQRRALAEKTLSDLASTDGLTALANRRHFDEVLEREWRRAIRDRTSVALLMVDGDFFKAYNDTYGHVQGDEALRAIAAALRSRVKRPADLVARFGGEEFAVLLPGTDLDGAILVGEAIVADIGHLDHPHTGSPLGRLTVSIGIAACLPAAAGSPLSLVQAADFALYEAKENGRNRIATGERLDLTSFGWRSAAV